MATRFDSMLADARQKAALTLNDVRDMVSQVDGDNAAKAAQVIEEENMDGFSRNEKIAVFLAGLMANLIDESEG
jgi:hypothetical protein